MGTCDYCGAPAVSVSTAFAISGVMDEKTDRWCEQCRSDLAEFNAKPENSMSLGYRLFGVLVRPMGALANHGEAVHQSAIDRRKLLDDYRPRNLEAFLNGNPAAVFAQTNRISRGLPCKEQHLVTVGE